MGEVVLWGVVGSVLGAGVGGVFALLGWPCDARGLLRCPIMGVVGGGVLAVGCALIARCGDP